MPLRDSFRILFASLARAPIKVGVALLFAGWGVATAQLVRQANSTLTLPQNPQTFGYQAQDAFPGITFTQPLGLMTAPGETDRLFVIEKTGRIQIVANLSSTPAKQLFFDLTSRVLVSDSTEEGLLGLAFHPDFATNRYFYVFYTTNTTTSAGTGRHDRLSRFTALSAPATNADILATEVPMISQRDEASNHNGGDLHFGPDGYLYVSLGDEGGGNDQYTNSQRIDKDFFAGMLRIDVDQRPGNLAPNSHPSVHANTYSVPADNPFVGATSFNGSPVTPANVHAEFWAVGLRNPWRFSIDAPTGRILVGDVGQGAREEIDLITRGGNYGWNYREGTIAGPRANPPAAASFTNPIWDTDRNTASSITGGVVYRGSRFAQLFGKYVFGDYPSGRIFVMTFPTSGAVQVQTILTDNSPTAFGSDPRNGDVLFASIGTGRIRRLTYNSTPTGTPLPTTLSATGAFANLATLEPAAGIVPYEPNVSFWSDYAIKRRWFSVPALPEKIAFAADGNWTLPAGTVWVKHFDLELTRGNPATARRLETRFLVKTSNGAYGVTYRWNAAQTEATLVPEEGADEAITINDGGIQKIQTWHYPSRAECLQCHTPVAGHALSFNTAQLNRNFPYPSGQANQLSALSGAGYFSNSVPPPANLRALAAANDNSATIEYRARSYLAANCVQCHQPGGAALGYWDARIATPTASAGLLNGPLVDQGGDAANQVMVPGDTGHSMLLTRISHRGPGQMPPLASQEIDQTAVALITSWITGTNLAPSIAQSPLGQTVATGQPVTFSVSAIGSPTLTYQWEKDGVAISGATGTSYSIGAVFWYDTGNYAVTVTNGSGSVTSAPAALALNNAGQRRVWLMNGASSTASIELGVFDPNWRIAVSADFNNDGHPDILWQNSVYGQCNIWLMNGTSYLGTIDLGTFDPNWRIVSAADFTGDGQSDILWQNPITGDCCIWLMNGTECYGSVALGRFDPSWRMIAAADFTHDGRPDILWQNPFTGDCCIWLMNGTACFDSVALGRFDTNWRMVAAADFNNDSHPDILWQNLSYGQCAVWLMNGTSCIGSLDLGSVDPSWRMAGAVDLNNDGHPDILWQRVSAGP